MADIRIERQGITSTDIPRTEFSTAQISGLEQIAVSTARDAVKLQQTSEKLFLANFEKEARKAINEISERNKADPEQLKKDLIESYKGFSSNAPFQLQSMMEAQYEIMGRPMINNATKFRTKLNNDELQASGISNITESFKNLEQSAAGMLSDDDHVAFDASRSAQLQMNTIQAMANLTGEDGTHLFTALQRNDFVEKGKQSLVSSGVRGWFDGQTNKMQAYKDFVDGKKKFKLYDEDGNVDREIDPLFEMNRGTFEQTRNYMESQLKSIFKEQSKVQDIESFQEKLDNGSLLIDPKSKKDRKSVDNYFDNVLAPQLSELPSAVRNDSIVEYIDQVGIIPSTVEGNLRATMRNGSVENQVVAADLISKIQESKPRALDELKDMDVSYGLTFTKNIRGGLTPDEAASLTTKEFNPLQKDLVSLRKKDFNDLEAGIDSEKDLKKEFAKRSWATLFFNQTNLPLDKDSFDQSRIDYINEYERQYVLTGNADVAKERAASIIGRQYGLSEISGAPRVMKYPPENYYAVDGISNDWMSEQLVSDIKNETGRDITKFDIALVPDPETAREVASNNEPAFSVLIRNDNGEYEPVQKNNRLMRFKFDSSKVVDDHNAAVKAEQEKMLIDEKTSFDQFKKGQKERFDILKQGLELAGTQPDAISTN